MMKKDGKEIYTFTGLINRMDACKDRSYCFAEKDIPDEVEFREQTYKLSDDKKFYYDQRTGVTLSEVVGETYGTDMFRFLTEHEFIVTPKEKIFLTSEEREFLRMCNMMINGGKGIDKVAVIKNVDSGKKSLVILSLWEENARDVVEFPIDNYLFLGLELDKQYTLKELNIYE